MIGAALPLRDSLYVKLPSLSYSLTSSQRQPTWTGGNLQPERRVSIIAARLVVSLRGLRLHHAIIFMSKPPLFARNVSFLCPVRRPLQQWQSHLPHKSHPSFANDHGQRFLSARSSCRAALNLRGTPSASPLRGAAFSTEVRERTEHSQSPTAPFHVKPANGIEAGEVLVTELSPMEYAGLEQPWDQLSEQELAQRKENLSMVDFYEALTIEDKPAARRSVTVVFDNQPAAPASREIKPRSRSDIQALHNLQTALADKGTHAQDIYQLYIQLSRPGVRFMSRSWTEALLLRLGAVEMEDKGQVAMLQYLSVFDDMHAAGLQPTAPQWSMAMHLTGRSSRRVTMSELDSTMRIWRRMETEAGIASDTAAMNILLDIATKSGHYTLAEHVLREMSARNLHFDRYTHLGIIYLYGCKEDGQGVRAAYKAFVDAKEVVDGMALTCVIVSLLKAGELPAAMNVYRRMLARVAPRDIKDALPQGVRQIGRVIAKFTKEHAGSEAKIAELQGGLNLGPNVVTYLSLVRHHAQRTGELMPIAELLDDMHLIGVPVHGQLFIELFQGFALHGNKLYTSWTRERLVDVWHAFRELVDLGTENVFVGPLTAGAILRAFLCCWGRPKAREVADELRVRWRKTDRHPDDMDDDLLRRIGL